MKVNCMKRMWSKMAYSLTMLGIAGSASLGMAALYGDVSSIMSSYSGANPCLTAGTVIEFTIRLGDTDNNPGGNFQLVPQAWALTTYGASTLQALYPLRVKMSTGGYATLVSTARRTEARLLGKTDFVFDYTVRAGDIGLPISIAGSAGNISSGSEFVWQNTDMWKVGDVTKTAFTNALDTALTWNTAPEAVWRFGSGYDAGAGESYDFDLSGAGIKVQTLAFDSSMAVNVGDKVAFTLSSHEVVTNTISLYVWSGDTNYYTVYNTSGIVGDGSNTVVGVTIAAGSKTSSTFTLYGIKDTTAVSGGTIPLYLSSHYGFDNTTTSKNYYVTAPVTVNPTTPTIRVTPTDSGTYTENDLTPHYLSVTLSEPAPTDTVVTLTYDTKYLRLTTNKVTIAKGSSAGENVEFYALDGSVSTVVKPQPTAFYTTVRGSTLVINNADPVIPEISNTTANTDIAKDFSWIINDVAADSPSMVVTWTWPDGTTVATGAVGTVSHVFTETGTHTVYVSAVDKDKGSAAVKSFTVTVTDIVPKPSISIQPPANVTLDNGRYIVNETNSTGYIYVTLSRKYTLGDSVTVKLTAVQPEAGVTNIVLSSSTVTIPNTATNVPVQFSILDGTIASLNVGVTITPEILDTASNTYTRIVPGKIYVQNNAPTIVAPANGDVTTYASIPVNSSQTFNYTIRDVNPDVVTNMVLSWDWGDGTDPTVVTGGTFTVGEAVNVGTVKGSVKHTYTSIPDTYYTATLTVLDKDRNPSAVSSFSVVVTKAPTISVAPLGLNSQSPRTLDVTESDIALTTPLIVYLSKAFNYTLTVDLILSNDGSSTPGRMTLETTKVTIPAGDTQSDPVYVTPHDGTTLSGSKFVITPSIDAGTINYAQAVAFYNGGVKTWTYRVQNVAPVLTVTPATTTETYPLNVQQNVITYFSWAVKDVNDDTVTVFWNFGDNTSATLTGKSGNVGHAYTGVGTYTVTCTTYDKDGLYCTVNQTIYVLVTPGKTVKVTPKGPNTADYKAGGVTYPDTLGAGMVKATDTSLVTMSGNAYLFTYGSTVPQAILHAIPYRVNSAADDATVNVTNWVSNTSYTLTPFRYDSFFYVWVGSDDSSFSEGTEATTPLGVDTATIKMTSDVTNQSTVAVSAVFSREYLPSDFSGVTAANLGDVNLDGVPDIYALKKDVSVGNFTGQSRAQVASQLLGSGGTGGGTTTTTGDTTTQDYIAIMNLGTFNNDANTNGTAVGDFLPMAWTDNHFIPSVSNVMAAAGYPFTGFMETRGFDEHLNYERDEDGNALDPDYPLDEPGAGPGVIGGTNPVLEDTDGDGLPDGWEYYFWWFYGHTAAESGTSTHKAGLVGYAYCPTNIAIGVEIKRGDILVAFDPIKKDASILDGANPRDMDNDGLSDVEELTLGTNPLNWDSDGDGMSDKYEVEFGLNPCDSKDGALNPDGDFMAYAKVSRLLVPMVNGSVTNYLLSDVSGDRYWTSYKYGDDNRADTPLAQGRLISSADLTSTYGEPDLDNVTSVEVLLLHFQVYQEFGFDPRVAWMDSVAGATGAMSNSKPFTSKDEYLLGKFMAEVCNKQGFSIAAKQLGNYTTNPRTPDTDATTEGRDGMPDGWEMYIGLNVNLMLKNYKTFNPASADVEAGYLPKMAITPWAWTDGSTSGTAYDIDNDSDLLSNAREFGGTVSSAMYTNTTCYATALTDAIHSGMKGVVSLARPSTDSTWINKFWATDPWNADTDGDGLSDAKEKGENIPVVMPTAAGRPSFTATFLYANSNAYSVASHAHIDCYRGAGLNPCSMDSDRDGLPDAWEYAYAGTNAVSSVTGNKYIDGGMDGTFGPANDYEKSAAIGGGDAFSWKDDYVNGDNASKRREMDWDNDGLENYQEYWTQAIRGFRYDTYTNVTPMDASCDPSVFFTAISNDWDIAYLGYWDSMQRESVMLVPSGLTSYVSTDPRDPDTDGDGMDDFYELYHGLNPILGASDLIYTASMGKISYSVNAFGGSALAPLPMDFVKYPWMNGLPEADPDADGLRNFEECILGYGSTVTAANTDPSPLWMTDSSRDDSLVASYYTPKAMFFWDVSPEMAPLYYKGYYVYSFEMNEGYDTDNDGISDKNELILTSTSQSEPQDSDDPVRRQALWFDGAQSAAETMTITPTSPNAFLTFSVEMWVCPENVTNEQVLIEKPVIYPPSDLSTPDKVVRANFRIGIKKDGRVYGMYQNAGGHDAETGELIAYGPILKVGTWVHVAIVMDGEAGKFTLYVNGSVQKSIATALMPANGVVARSINADVGSTTNAVSTTITSDSSGGYGEDYYTYPSYLVLGASDLSLKYHKMDKGPSWATLTNYFNGYIDEVRVWDGARTSMEILENYNKRFTKSDLLANRSLIAEKKELGWSRYEGDTQLPAELLYHYTFDNLFSADVTNSVATSPRGFMAPETVATNRPADWVVGWWSQWETRNLVYNNYAVIPWIENLVEHLASVDGTVQDSRYWTKSYSGKVPTAATAHGLETYTFHSANDPYGFTYRNDMTDGFAHRILSTGSTNSTSSSYVLAMAKAANWEMKNMSDLLPLGNAWAKFCTNMWDNASAGSVWAETGTDADSDGLPDWWELYKYGDITAYNWNDIDPDNPSQTVGEAYMRDIAKGYTESNNPGSANYDASKLIPQTSDVDGDGLPDWWENLYNLNPSDATGDNGAYGDPDEDGLCNYAEYLISEYYHELYPSVFPILRPDMYKSNLNQVDSDYYQRIGTSSMYLGDMFADHDMIEDAWEDLYSTDYVNRYVYDANLDPDDDGWSNWAEARYGTSSLRTDPTLKSYLSPNGDTINEFPIPAIKTTVQYAGSFTGPIVVWAYTSADVNGKPDARFTIASESASKTKYLGYWSDKTIKGYLSPGSIQPGTVKIYFNDSVDNKGVLASGIVGIDMANTPSTDGILYLANEGTPTAHKIGTINYLTGAYEWDMSQFKGLSYTFSSTTTSSSSGTSSSSTGYAVASNSYITVAYTAQQVDSFPKTFYLADADASTTELPSDGHIHEGMNYFFAFMDVSGDGLWQPGEPFGVAQPFGVNVGWDMNEVKIELTDYQAGYLRFSPSASQRSEDVFLSKLSSGKDAGGTGTTGGNTGSGSSTLGAETHIRVMRTAANGFTSYARLIIDGTLKAPRTCLTEADLIGMGSPAFDWGFPGVSTTVQPTTMSYAIYIGDGDITTNTLPSYTFTNTYDSVQAQAVGVYPADAYVYSAQPTFKWTMPVNYPAFAIRIYNSASKLVYDSGIQSRPIRTLDGTCVWTAPIYANDYIRSTGYTFSSNQTYTWQVLAMDAKYALESSGRWSAAKRFRLDVNAPRQAGGFGGLKARVKYYGPATKYLSNRVRLQVFNNAAFGGVPCAEYTLASAEVTSLTDTSFGKENARVYGLTPNAEATYYYVMAFIDQNQNGVRDAWESWGYANYYGISDKPYDPYPVSVDGSANLPVVDIRIEDADTDQDWFPDAWEYDQYPNSSDFLSLIGSSVAPSTAAGNDAEVNWTLGASGSRGGLSMGALLTLSSSEVSDADGDGLDDRLELLTGSSASSKSTSGDGYTDGDKVSLGLAPADSLSLNLTGISLTNLEWQVTVSRAASAATRSLLSLTSNMCAYEVQYKASLSDTSWTTVASGTVTLDGAQAVTDGVASTVAQSPNQGFFRVILKHQ